MPTSPKHKYHASYTTEYSEGDLWIRTFDELKYDSADGLSGKSGRPILFIGKIGDPNG